MAYEMTQPAKSSVSFNFKKADATHAAEEAQKNPALACVVREYKVPRSTIWASVGEYTPKEPLKFKWLEVSRRDGKAIDDAFEAKIIADMMALGLEPVEGGHTGLED